MSSGKPHARKTKYPDTPSWFTFTTLEQAERQIEETTNDLLQLYSTERQLKDLITSIMEERHVNRRQAFKLVEWALAKLAREEGQAVSIIARVDNDDDQDYDDEDDDGVDDGKSWDILPPPPEE